MGHRGAMHQVCDLYPLLRWTIARENEDSFKPEGTSCLIR